MTQLGPDIPSDELRQPTAFDPLEHPELLGRALCGQMDAHVLTDELGRFPAVRLTEPGVDLTDEDVAAMTAPIEPLIRRGLHVDQLIKNPGPNFLKAYMRRHGIPY